MNLNELSKRREKSTVLVTLSVSGNSNINSVVNQLRKEYATSFNIKDKWTRKNVQKAISKIMNKLSNTKLPDTGFILFGSYDGVWIVIPDKRVNRDFYICGKTFDVEYLRQLMNPQQKIGKIQLSSKKTIISIIEGEFEETKFKLTSGIPGKHGKGGQSQGRFARKREEEVDAFLRKIYSYSKQLKVDKWIFEGDKEMVKRFKRINYQN